MQYPNPIEMRWIEVCLVGILMSAIGLCVVFFVTLFQGALLSKE